MMTSRIRSAGYSLLRDDRGQDLLEYAMLTALVALVTIAAWAAIENRVGQAYQNYDARTQNLGATTPDPAGGGS